MFKSIKLLVLSLAFGVLAGCGGGGDSGGSNTQSNPYSMFFGNWGWCEDHELEKYEVTSSGANEAKISITVNYYTNMDCTGQIVASESPIMASMANYENIGSKSVTQFSGVGSINLSLAKSKFSVAQTSVALTGTGVFKNSRNQTCIRLTTSKERCFNETYPYTQPAGSTDLYGAVADGVNGGKSGKFFYIVDLSGTTYKIIDYYLAM
jgi:hypothetical protein